ncbi:MAG: hypothetical protein MN733_27695, partial [Nitrososphaera sp.]|nr:hypothetical protein [Nitrososphaera sp.]
LAPARGQWISPDGEIFKERMIPVRIMCTSTQMDNIAAMTLDFYEQKAVMYYRISSEVKIIFVGAKKKKG